MIVPTGNKLLNVEGEKFKLQDITCHNHSSVQNENAETQTSIKKIYITSEIHFRINLQGKYFQKYNKIYIIYSRTEIHQKFSKI